MKLNMTPGFLKFLFFKNESLFRSCIFASKHYWSLISVLLSVRMLVSFQPKNRSKPNLEEINLRNPDPKFLFLFQNALLSYLATSVAGFTA